MIAILFLILAGCALALGSISFYLLNLVRKLQEEIEELQTPF